MRNIEIESPRRIFFRKDIPMMEVSSADPSATDIKEKLREILKSLMLYQEKSLSNKSDGELVIIHTYD